MNSEPAGREVERPAVVDADRADVARVHVLEGGAARPTRALSTEVPVPSTLMSLKWTLVIEYRSFTGKSLTSMIAL